MGKNNVTGLKINAAGNLQTYMLSDGTYDNIMDAGSNRPASDQLVNDLTAQYDALLAEPGERVKVNGYAFLRVGEDQWLSNDTLYTDEDVRNLAERTGSLEVLTPDEEAVFEFLSREAVTTDLAARLPIQLPSDWSAFTPTVQEDSPWAAPVTPIRANDWNTALADALAEPAADGEPLPEPAGVPGPDGVHGPDGVFEPEPVLAPVIDFTGWAGPDDVDDDDEISIESEHLGWAEPTVKAPAYDPDVMEDAVFIKDGFIVDPRTGLPITDFRVGESAEQAKSRLGNERAAAREAEEAAQKAEQADAGAPEEFAQAAAEQAAQAEFWRAQAAAAQAAEQARRDRPVRTWAAAVWRPFRLLFKFLTDA